MLPLAISVVYAQNYQLEVSGAYINGDNGAEFLDESSFADLTWAMAMAEVSGENSVNTFNVGCRFVTGKI